MLSARAVPFIVGDTLSVVSGLGVWGRSHGSLMALGMTGRLSLTQSPDVTGIEVEVGGESIASKKPRR